MTAAMKEVENLFQHFTGLAGGDRSAAAMLVLAHATLTDRQSHAPAADGMLNVKQTAELLSVSTGTVRNLVTSGRLPCSKIGSGRGTLRFSPADIDRYKKEAAGHWA